MQSPSWSRRSFLKSAAVSSLSAKVVPRPAITSTREVLTQFPYGAVTLAGGPLGTHYDAVRAHFLSLSNDRLLKVYRQHAGLPAPGDDMGGWYDLRGFVPGHSLGQYISGLARFGAATGDTTCLEKVRDLVTGFAATLGPANQSILRPESNQWICYTLDKHLAGLIDAATLGGLTEVPGLLDRVFRGTLPLLPRRGRDRIGKQNPPYDETYVLPENLFLAGDITGNPAFHDLAHRYLLDREFFNPLAAGNDPFPGQHAYSHAIALSSAGRAFLAFGDAKYKRAMEHAFYLLTTTQQFASGGWGPNETFVTPHRGELYKSLAATEDHFETPCGSYAATKLARYLLRFTGDARYGDNLERVVYNTILAAKSPDADGDYPYYSTYSAAAAKVFYPRKWPCCSGTLAQTVADYVLNIYFAGAQGPVVNLYAPSTLRWKQHGIPVTLTQQTAFPAEDRIAFTVHAPSPVEFALQLRIPHWTSGPSLAINGKPWAAPLRPGTFETLDRLWHPNDTISLLLPQTFRTEAIDDRNPGTAALMRGPVQYVALRSTGRATPGSSPRPLPPLDTNLSREGPLSFSSGGRMFVPLYTVESEIYDTYFSL